MPADRPLEYAMNFSGSGPSSRIGMNPNYTVGSPNLNLNKRSTAQRRSYLGGTFRTGDSTTTATTKGPILSAKNTRTHASSSIRKTMVDRMYKQAGMAGSALSVGGMGGKFGAAAVGLNVAGMGSYMTGGGYFQGAVTGGITGATVLGGMSLASYGMKASMKSGSMPMNSFTKGTANAMATMVGKGARRYTFGAGAMLGGLMFGGNRSHAGGFNKSRGNGFGR